MPVFESWLVHVRQLPVTWIQANILPDALDFSTAYKWLVVTIKPKYGRKNDENEIPTSKYSIGDFR